MKVALVRREFGGFGGAGLYLKRLLEAFHKGGLEVILVTADEPNDLPGVEVRQVKLSGGRAERVFLFDQLARRQLKLEPVDCVFSLDRLTAQDVFRAGDGVHRKWLAQRRRYAPWWKRQFVGRSAFHRMVQWVEARIFDPVNTRYVIVNSDMVRREIVEFYHYPEERVHLVRNGVEMDRWQGGDREVTRQKWGVGKTDYLLLFAGSGWERKGLQYVLSAVEHLNDSKVKLLVVGKGKPPRRVTSGVQFAGLMEDVGNAYAAADLFVFPPIYEPSANVCFEALAAGLPVVTSACNGASEVIEEKVNGTVVADPSDVESLVAAIKFWRERPEARPVPVKADLSLERNVRETLGVLMLAARERASEQL